MRTQLIGAIICAALALGATHAPAAAELYSVTIENLIPGGPDTGQPLTPPVVVVHDNTYTLVPIGGFATPGLELLAEEGMPVVLVGEANAAPGVSAVEVGAGPFFDSVTVLISGSAGDLVSVVTMLARTNDLITGIAGVPLPAGEMVIDTNVYDAGTELNTGMVAHIPFYGNAGGPDETEVIAHITNYAVVDDPVHGALKFEFPPAARITIRPGGATPVEAATWGSIKATWGGR